MNTTIENVSRPGQQPQRGDWVRATTTRGGIVIAVVEYEFH